jgi:acetyl esterase/lipase
VSPNYRLVPRVKLRDAVADCFDALGWVHRNIRARVEYSDFE